MPDDKRSPYALSRREFVAASLATGYALSAQPAGAQAIVTDQAGLEAGAVWVPVQGGDIPAYHAMPAQGGPFPTVVVVQEIFGVHEHIRDICRRLAKLGYFAVSSELFAREADVSKLPDIESILEIVARVPDAQVMSDIDATIAWAIGTGKCDPARIGVTGFCWGGRITWLYAAHNPRLRAAVAWYGRLVGTPNELQPTYPVDVAESIAVPVLGLYGGQDQGIPLSTVENMREALKRARAACEIHVYPDAPHAFFADYRPSYRAGEAEDGWRRMLDWFRRHGLA